MDEAEAAIRVTRLGGIFSNWMVVYSMQFFFENYRSSANVWTTFTQCISDVFIVTKNGLGHVLGDFFSQTHPVTLAATANDLPFINNYLLSNFSLLPKHAPQKKIHA
jgi:hypothetical protein